MFKRELQVYKKVSFEPNLVALETRDKITLKGKKFLTSGTQNVWYVADSMYWEVRNYISSDAFLKPICRSFTLDFGTENIVSYKEVWTWNEFDIRLNDEVNFFIRGFREDFYFPSAFIVVKESY